MPPRDRVELGVVDHLGDLEAAIEAAAKRADLDDEYRLEYFEEAPESKWWLLGRWIEADVGGDGG